MRPRIIDTYIVDAVKDETIPIAEASLPAGFPALDILRFCPVIIVNPASQQDSLPFDSDKHTVNEASVDYELKQLTDGHQRSFEIVHSSLSEPWSDEFGNVYGSINLKGNNFSNPKVLATATATDRLIAYGLQESSVIRRVVKASRLLREQSVGTEYIVGLAEPQEYPWSNVDEYTDSAEHVPLAEYKRRLVEKSWFALSEEMRTAEALVDAASKFERMTFYISMRAMDSSYRVADLRLQGVIEEVFGLVNKSRLKPGEEPYDHTNLSDRERFLVDHVAPKLGENLAKMHLLGLAHKYLNAQNITVFGSIVDLDSVHGKSLELGDEPITSSDILDDMTEVTSALQSFGLGFFSKKDPGHVFIEAYAHAIIAGAIETDAINLLAGLLEQIDKRFAEVEYQDLEGYKHLSDMAIRLKVQEILMNKFFSQETEFLSTNFDAWADSKLDEIREAINKGVTDDVGVFKQILFDEHLNQTNDPNLDFDKLIDSIDSENLNLIWEWLMPAVMFAIVELHTPYIEEQIKHEPELVKIANLRSPELIRLICKRLSFAVINYDKTDKIAVRESNYFMPNLKTALKEQWKLEFPNRLFPDYDADLSVRSSETFAMMETKNVPLDKVIDYIESSCEELQIMSNLDSKASWTGKYSLADDDSVLSEVISDSMIDGMTFDSELPIKHLEYSLKEPSSKYVLFVEQKPDGTRRLRLQVTDQKLADTLAQLERKQVLELLRQYTIRSDQLFDADAYIQSKKERDFFVTETEAV